jgi:quercetin dioxygenase-like cupin family protein
MMGEWGGDGWAVRPGEGLTIDTGGQHSPEILVRGSEVDHKLGAFVFTHGQIPENPPHAHLDFMKIVFVLEGEYAFRVGDVEFSGEPGTLVVVPKGSQHTFTTATGGKMLFVCSPSGNEEMFIEMGKLGSGATPEQLEALNERFHTVTLPGESGAPWRQM